MGLDHFLADVLDLSGKVLPQGGDSLLENFDLQDTVLAIRLGQVSGQVHL